MEEFGRLALVLSPGSDLTPAVLVPTLKTLKTLVLRVLRVLRVPLLAATFFPIGHRFIPHGTPDAERSRWRLAAEPFEMHGLAVGFRAATSAFPARI